MKRTRSDSMFSQRNVGALILRILEEPGGSWKNLEDPGNLPDLLGVTLTIFTIVVE